MFYANFVLAKKGPLAKVWLAAHWEKKLSKAHVFETDLQKSIESIISPKVKIALRTSGHLLLGVVRIYSRKTKYLLTDCTEALIKIKMAFRPDVVDLPLDNQKAAISAITLPEFQEWEAMMNNMGTFDITATLQNNQCRVEEITMKEDLYSSRYLTNDNFFGDTPFGETSDVQIMREEFDENEHQQTIHSNATANEDDLKDRNNLSSNESNLELAMNDPMEDVGFGAGEGLDFLEDYGLGEMTEVIPNVKPPTPSGVDELLDDIPLDDDTVTEDQTARADKQLEKSDQAILNAVAEMTEDLALDVDFEKEAPAEDAAVPEQGTELTTGIETTLFSRDTEAFALEPVDVTVGKEKKRKRKRKLVVDDIKIISSEDIKEHIESSDDIVKPAVVAPSSRWRMDIQTTNISKSLFEPQHSKPVSFRSKKSRLNSMYAKNHTINIPEDLALPSSSSQEDEEEVTLEDPTDILRDGDDNTALFGEARDEVTKGDVNIIEETSEFENNNNADELAAIEDVQPMVDMDIEMNDNEPIDLQVPPPFQLDITDKTVDVIEDITAKELNDTTTEEEETEGEQDKHDVQDKRWTKRTQQTLHMLNKATKKNSIVNFKDLTKKCNRKQAAHRFYTLLTLNKEKCITVQQDGLFADIFIERGERFASYV